MPVEPALYTQRSQLRQQGLCCSFLKVGKILENVKLQ